MSKKVIIMIIIAVIIFLSAIGGGFFMLWSKMSQMNAPGSEAAVQAEAEEGGGEADTIGPMYSLDSFVVNLAQENSNRYLRVTMELELDNELLKTEIEQRLPQVRNALLMILPSKTTDEINSVDGKMALRDEIIEEINGFLSTGEVVNIYFTEFVIQ